MKKISILLGVLALVVALSGAPAFAALVGSNGSFESGTAGSPFSTLSATDGVLLMEALTRSMVIGQLPTEQEVLT